MSNNFRESETTEFKAELNDKLEKVVVAFLNSKGGDLYIGVADNGSILEIKNIDKILLTISDRIKNNILPTCLGFYDVFTEEHNSKIFRNR